MNELRMDLHSALSELKLKHIRALESHSSDLEDESEQEDEIATMETGSIEDFASDDDGSDDGLDDMETEIGKFKLLCQERTRTAVIEFLQENLEWVM